MKASIYVNGKLVFSSKRISQKALLKKEGELLRTYGCLKMKDRVLKGFAVFTSN